MSERPTDTRRAAAAHGLGRDAQAPRHRHDVPVGAGHRTVAERAADFRQGAPFLVERATLYDPEPLGGLDPRPSAAGGGALPPRRLLPAALTLLGVVVVVGLSAGILFVRNADVVRHAGADDDGTGRLEQFSERGLPKSDRKIGSGPQPNSSTITYDLTRRPNEVIVGAWRSQAEEEARHSDSPAPSAPSRRRPLPRRYSLAPPPLPPEPVTRAVVASPPRYYDAPEPRRRVADGDPPKAASTPPPIAELPPERQAPNVVARVGRESDAAEELGPPVEIPLEALVLPQRRPDPAEIEEASRASARARRERLLQLQRRLRQKQVDTRKREYDGRQWIPEALYGNRFLGRERYFP